MTEDNNNLAEKFTPTDKKRIALLSGAVGQSDRLVIRGQIVDIPVSEEQKHEVWNHFHVLPKSLQNDIHPLHDFSMSIVRRPKIQIEILDINPADFSQDKAQDAKVLYTSESFTAGDDSFFTHSITESIKPGQFVARIILRGIDSLRQSVSDLAYVRHGDSLILKKDIPIGYGKILVLKDDYEGYIITSDIDQTFLDTPMHSRRGLLETLFQKPASRHPIPGMPVFYQEIQKSHYLPEQNSHEIPTLFISASPHFFRRSLSVIFENNNIKYHSLHLKYLVSTVDNIIQKIKESSLNFNDLFTQGMNEAVERSLKFLGSSLASLFDQIAYKLTVLLESRLMQPTPAREILLGDNTEGDYFIFTIYQYLLSGAITGKELEKYLYNLNFHDKEVITRDTAKKLVKMTDENLKLHGKTNPVVAVWVNLSKNSPDEKEMSTIIKQSLPENLAKNFDTNSKIQKPIGCYTGVGFGLAAFDQGLINENQLKKIIDDAQDKSYQEKQIDGAAITRIINQFSYKNSNKPDLASLTGG